MPSKDHDIISDRPVDEIPEPGASRRGPYQGLVEKALANHRSREVRCASREAMQATYMGITRAIERLEVTDQVRARQRAGDTTFSVYIEFIDQD